MNSLGKNWQIIIGFIVEVLSFWLSGWFFRASDDIAGILSLVIGLTLALVVGRMIEEQGRCSQ